MSADLIGILRASVALLGPGFRLSSRLDDVDRCLASVEGLVEWLGLSARVPAAPASGD